MYTYPNTHSNEGGLETSEEPSYSRLKHFGREDFEVIDKVENISIGGDCKLMTRPEENLSYYMCLYPAKRDKIISGVYYMYTYLHALYFNAFNFHKVVSIKVSFMRKT